MPRASSKQSEDYNRRRERRQRRFGRALPEPLHAPFYGIKVTVALYHTQGGLKVNPDGQVLRADGSVIPNLYAGGGVAVGVSGKGWKAICLAMDYSLLWVSA